MKEGLQDNILVQMLVVMLFLSAASSSEVYASTNVSSTEIITEGVDLGNPFYEEHYKAMLGVPEISKSFTGNFTGEGIPNGNLNVSADVNFIRTFRDNGTTFLHGYTQLISENGDTAGYNFNAFTNYNSDGTSQGSGAVTFNEKATGELSFLSNTIGIYKNFVDSSGNGTFPDVAVEVDNLSVRVHGL
jgi:hypothetical protein